MIPSPGIFLIKSLSYCLSGQNMLLVGIAGPKTPCEEIIVKHMGRQRFTISYLLKETGSYKLVVKWGDEHIPGSPFALHCS